MYIRCSCGSCIAGQPNQCFGPSSKHNQQEWSSNYTEACVQLITLICEGHNNAFDIFKKMVINEPTERQ